MRCKLSRPLCARYILMSIKVSHLYRLAGGGGGRGGGVMSPADALCRKSGLPARPAAQPAINHSLWLIFGHSWNLKCFRVTCRDFCHFVVGICTIQLILRVISRHAPRCPSVKQSHKVSNEFSHFRETNTFACKGNSFKCTIHSGVQNDALSLRFCKSSVR